MREEFASFSFLAVPYRSLLLCSGLLAIALPNCACALTSPCQSQETRGELSKLCFSVKGQDADNALLVLLFRFSEVALAQTSECKSTRAAIYRML